MHHAARTAPLLLLLVACAAAPPDPAPPAPVPTAETTLIVVRHAERDDSVPGNDPPLSAAGRTRARVLADVLEHAGVQAIYVSPRRRTGLTAAPLAERIGVASATVDLGADPVDSARQLARETLARHRGGVVLIVHHSNTVPVIVRTLGGSAADIADDVFDDLYVVTVPARGETRTIRARYGAPRSGGD
jgi:broad specificity phosphatase PhoE